MAYLLKDDVRKKFAARKATQLLASIAIDGVGCLSYLIPGFAETFDIVLAPVLALAVYGVHRTKAGAVFGFVEEILPFTDFIPTATTIWVKRYVINEEKTYTEFENILRKDFAIVDQQLS